MPHWEAQQRTGGPTVNNQKKAERACRRFTKARKRQNFVTPIQGTDGRALVMAGSIELTVTSIGETDSASPMTYAEVSGVLHDVLVEVEEDAADTDALAKQAADIAILRGHEHVTLEDLEDAKVPVVLSQEDASVLATYIEHSLNVLGGGLLFMVAVEPTIAMNIAPIICEADDAPPFDEGNVLPLAQAKFEAMVAA